MNSVVHSVSASVSCFVAQCCGGGGGTSGKERKGGEEAGGGGGREKAENAVCDGGGGGGGGGRREKKQTMLQSLVLSGCHQITDVGLRYVTAVLVRGAVRW